MKLSELNMLSIGITELLKSTLKTKTAYKLTKLNKKLLQELDPVVEVMETKIKELPDGLEENEKLNRMIEIQNELLNEEVDIELIELSLDDLPEEIKGSVMDSVSILIKEEE